MNLDAKKGIILDIGCGVGRSDRSVVGIDFRRGTGVDIVHDLESYPWPLPSECVNMAVASHIVEHIDPAKMGFFKFMNEVWRLLKPGAEFIIATPYCTSTGYFRDPSHCNPVHPETWCYFDPEEGLHKGSYYRLYRPLPWRIKLNTWDVEGNIETALVKREMKTEYGVYSDYLMDLIQNTKMYAEKDKIYNRPKAKTSKDKDAVPQADEIIQTEKAKI
jgi:SAM-dependent methyltransferase